jgi:hypothetical protein
MDPGLDRYDGEHVVTAHPLMSADEWREAYQCAWDAFYTMEHVETLMRRAAASGVKTQKILKLAFISQATLRLPSKVSRFLASPKSADNCSWDPTFLVS